MFSQDDDGQQGVVLAVLSSLLALVIAGVVALAVASASAGRKTPGATPAPAAAVQPASVLAAQPGSVLPAPALVPALPASASTAAETRQSAAQAASDAATVTVEYGVVKFYFASGKADLAPGASQALEDMVKAGKAGRQLVIAGFHDATGNPARNAELARQRAMGVRAALTTAGVPERQIALKKPEQIEGGKGLSEAEARRVEISVQ